MAVQLQVVFDCTDVDAQADFWAAATGYVVQPPPPGFDDWPAFLTQVGVPEELWDSRSAIIDPEGHGPRIFFQKVPEGKVVKNRLHLDLQAGAGAEPERRLSVVTDEVARLTSLGASVVRDFDESGEHWVVMQDPEGNEFCVS